ncbi:hypothetical protein D3C86_1515960 [compost metagenome]
MPDQTEQPAARRAACGVERMGMAPDLDEGVVQHVFRQGPVPHDTDRHAQQVRGCMLVETAQGRHVPRGATGERGFVVEMVVDGGQGGGQERALWWLQGCKGRRAGGARAHILRPTVGSGPLGFP